MYSFQKETKSALTALKRDQTLLKKSLEGLEKKSVTDMNKKLQTITKQNQQIIESVQNMQSLCNEHILSKLDKLDKLDKFEAMNEMCAIEHDRFAPFSLPTVRKKRNRKCNTFSQESQLKRVESGVQNESIEGKVSGLIKNAIHNKSEHKTDDLFLVDDFF